MSRRWFKAMPVVETAIAQALWEGHGDLIAKGFRLCRSTRFHRAKHGLMTARLVYRYTRHDGQAIDSLVVTIRNVDLQVTAS